MNKYIDFVLILEGTKTNKWHIISKSSGAVLGLIKWYAPWRQYCFLTLFTVVWNVDCLRSVQEFITAEMEKRKK